MSKSEKRQRTVVIGVRCTPWEKQLIEKVAAMFGVTPAEFVRDAALARAQEVVDGLATRAAEGGAA